MRKHLTTAILIFLSLFLLNGCSSAVKYYAVRNHKPQMSTLGFSITPPPGDNWYETHQKDSLLFLKLGKHKTYSLTTKATELVLHRRFAGQTDFMEYVKEIKTLPIKASHLANASSVFSWADESSPFCVRYQQAYEDHRYKNLRKNDYVKVKNIGLVCMHPDTPEVGIDISYVEKSIASAHPTSYQEEGEKFLSSLTFYPKHN